MNCDGVFDIGRIEGEQKCECQVNAIFDAYTNKCIANCRVDTLSTKSYTSFGCVCKKNAEWDDVENKCKCSEGFTENTNLNIC